MEAAGGGLRAELAGLTPKELRKRARALGADQDTIDDLDDKAAALELVLSLTPSAPVGVDGSAAVRAEIEGLPLKALKKRARAMGVDEDAIDDLHDAPDVKAAAVELVFAATPSLPEAVPEVRGVHSAGGLAPLSPAASDAQPEPEPQQLMTMPIPSTIADFMSAFCIFGSMRFPVPEEARQLFAALKAAAGARPQHHPLLDPRRSVPFSRLTLYWCVAACRRPPEDRARATFLPHASCRASHSLSLSLLSRHLLTETPIYVSAQVDMQAGADIDKEVYGWIEHCSAFLVMGTRSYGEDTGNSACTCVRTSNQPRDRETA
jgi:hypothetical protein